MKTFFKLYCKLLVAVLIFHIKFTFHFSSPEYFEGVKVLWLECFLERVM